MGTILSPAGTPQFDRLVIDEDGAFDAPLVTLRRGHWLDPNAVALTLTPHEVSELANVIEAYVDWANRSDEDDQQ